MYDLWTFLVPLLRWLFYPAVLLAAGGVIFAVLLQPWLNSQAGRYLRRVTRRAALAGAGLGLLHIPAAAGSLGGDLASASDPLLLGLVIDTPVGLSALVTAGALMLLLAVESVPAAVPGLLRLVAPALVILSMTLVGHATTRGVLTALLLGLHLAGVSFWLAALLPLRRMCVDADDLGALAMLADEFGRLAVVLVTMLVVAGLCYAALLLGSPAALVTSSYGLLLLAKIGLVGGLLLLAAWNRLRLVPALQRGEHDASRHLRRVIEMEMGVAGGILLATSLLTTSVTLPMGGM